VLFGSLYLVKELGGVIPDWILTWQTMLIAIGLVAGVKSNFKRWGWLIPVFIGSAFLISDFNPELNIRPIVWPIVIIVIGLVMIFKPKRRFNKNRWERWQNYQNVHTYKGGENSCYAETVTSGEDHINSTTFMGGIKKNIISKNFKGGEITNILGGAEYNLSQADFTEAVTLEINQVFGGTKLIIPSHWEIKSELVAVLGGIDDKRPIYTNLANSDHKIMILRGTTIFGGIEIRS
jgi:predicted membrane protein